MTHTNRAIPKYFVQIGVFILFYAGTLFISAGHWDWAGAWIFVALVAAGQIGVALILLVSNPELMGERAESTGRRDLDRRLAGVMALFGPLSMCIVAGLAMRFGWLPPLPLALQSIGVVLAVLGSLTTIWAMATNKFFYGVLRIAPEKGHRLCTSGPYHYVRHPGYLGTVVFDLATPLVLNSVWAFIPAVLTVYAIVARAALEDQALQTGLEGYPEYARQVRYRLLPGVW